MLETNLPAHWKTARLGDYIFKPEYGYTASATYDSIGAKFLRITDIQDDNVDWRDVPYCECDGDIQKKYLLAPGDIVIARVGATTGKAFLVNDCPKSVFASYLIRVKTKPPLLSSFLSTYFRTEDYWRQIRQNKGGRLKGGVNIPILQSLKIPLPPLPEQRAIAHALQTIQEAKAARQRELELERERKAALMDHLFSYGTKGEPRKQTEIGEIPDSWEVIQLKEIANLRRDNVNPQDCLALSYVGLEYIDSGESQLKRWGDASEVKSAKSRFYSNDVLYGKLRAYLDKAVIAEMEGICSTDILVVTPNSKTLPRFLVCILHTSPFISHAVATSTGVNHPRTSWNSLGKFTFALPSLSEQRAIADVFEAIAKKTATLEQEAARLDELFHAMLDELMTGKRSAAPLIDSEA